MPNYGLLNNIASGMREGLITYQTINNMRNQQTQVENAQKMQAQQMRMQAAQHGLIESQDLEGNTVYQRDPNYIKEQVALYRAKDPFQDMTPGQKAADTAFGKDYSDYAAGGGESSVNKQLGLLKESKQKLEEDKDLTGGWTTKVPILNSDAAQDVINPDMARVRDDIRGAIQGSLKQVLGSQFTEKEGERIFSRAFNPRLSSEENARRAQNEIDALESMASRKKEAGEYFQKHGTLQGYEPGGARGLVKEEKQAESSGPKRGEVVDGYEFLGGDPADQKSWRKK